MTVDVGVAKLDIHYASGKQTYAHVAFSDTSKSFVTETVQLKSGTRSGAFALRTGKHLIQNWSFQLDLSSVGANGLSQLKQAMLQQDPLSIEVSIKAATAAAETWVVRLVDARVAGIRFMETQTGSNARLQFEVFAEDMKLELPVTVGVSMPQVFVKSLQTSLGFKLKTKKVAFPAHTIDLMICEMTPAYWTRSMSRQIIRPNLKMRSDVLKTPDSESVDYEITPASLNTRTDKETYKKHLGKMSEVIGLEFYVTQHSVSTFTSVPSGTTVFSQLEALAFTVMYWPAESKLPLLDMNVQHMDIDKALGKPNAEKATLPPIHKRLRIPQALFEVGSTSTSSKSQKFGIVPQIFEFVLPDGETILLTPFQVQLHTVSLDSRNNPFMVRVRIDGIVPREIITFGVK